MLIGATTENPSFEVNAALLSRSRVVVLKPLGSEELGAGAAPALADAERGLGRFGADGGRGRARVPRRGRRRRRAHGAQRARAGGATAPPGDDGEAPRRRGGHARGVARKALLYDKAGEEHYNIISALHKSMRDSDPDAALYWLARMLEAGEDPLFVARRLVRFASEDVGLADPQALVVAVAAKQAVHFLGMPEGALALAESSSTWRRRPRATRSTRPTARPPGRARDAGRAGAAADPQRAHRLMKDLGYGAGYRYAHDEAEGVAGMACLPEGLRGEALLRAHRARRREGDRGAARGRAPHPRAGDGTAAPRLKVSSGAGRASR